MTWKQCFSGWAMDTVKWIGRSGFWALAARAVVMKRKIGSSFLILRGVRSKLCGLKISFCMYLFGLAKPMIKEFRSQPAVALSFARAAANGSEL